MAKIKAPREKVTPLGMKILLWSIIAFVFVDTLAKFRIVDITSIVNPMFIPVVASLFILAEIGVMQVITRKKRLDGIQAFGMVVAVLGLLSVLLIYFGIAVSQLMTIQGVVNIALGIFVVIEIFR